MKCNSVERERKQGDGSRASEKAKKKQENRPFASQTHIYLQAVREYVPLLLDQYDNFSLYSLKYDGRENYGEKGESKNSRIDG